MSYGVLVRKPESAPAAKAKAPAKAASSVLRIGDPNDAYEREADRVADEVMAGGRPRPEWSFSRISVATPLQRKCACGGSGGWEGECKECEEKKTLQRKAAGPAEPGVAPPIVHEVLNSPGQPLDTASRAFFEPRFGHDFSQVRVHVGGQASASARAVRARAYSVGNAVVFDEGQYRPESLEGRRLIAHELAHSVQQGFVRVPSDGELEVSRPDDRLEVEANRMSKQVAATESVVAPLAKSGPTNRPHLFREVQPPSGGTAGGAPNRIVFLDADVVSQIAGGNKPAAEALLQMRSSGADIRIARPTFNETQRGLPQQVAARRVVVEQLGIKIDEGAGLESRMPTYETYAKKGVMIQTKDIPMVAAAKASGGEI